MLVPAANSRSGGLSIVGSNDKGCTTECSPEPLRSNSRENSSAPFDNRVEQTRADDRRRAIKFVQRINKADRTRFKLLHLFSGPSGRPGGFAAYCEYHNIDVEEVDWIIDAREHNLIDDLVFDRLLRRVKDEEFDGCLSGTPCETSGTF